MNTYKAHPENISKNAAEKHLDLLKAIKSKNLSKIKNAIARHIMRKLEDIDEN
jgi:DNA-binding GntR family transcriptional regulator